MNYVLQAVNSLFILVCVASCDTKHENFAKDDEVILQKFDAYPIYFEDPDTSTISSWEYILRYTEKEHNKTPIVIDTFVKENLLRTQVRRICRDEVELKYTRDIHLDHGSIPRPPEWAMKLAEVDDTSGFDGTLVTVCLYTKDLKRTIHRWSPNHNEKHRDLAEFNRWVDGLYITSGIRARDYFGEGNKKQAQQDAAGNPLPAE